MEDKIKFRLTYENLENSDIILRKDFEISGMYIPDVLKQMSHEIIILEAYQKGKRNKDNHAREVF